MMTIIDGKLHLSEQKSVDIVLGDYNQRIKLYGLTGQDLSQDRLDWLCRLQSAQDRPYGKIIVYALPGGEMDWLALGFVKEGVIGGFFRDQTDAVIRSYFIDPHRRSDELQAKHDKYIQIARDKPSITPACPKGFTCQLAKPEDAAAISNLLKRTFKDYPSSLEADHLEKAMVNRHSHFRLIRNHRQQLVAAMSAEIDHKRSSAEMTDCATDPDYRGLGLMACLLVRIEQDLNKQFGIINFYTLARADMLSINCVFSKLDYHYTGRLVNNCRMPNGWESMNIWCKRVPQKENHGSSQSTSK